MTFPEAFGEAAKDAATGAAWGLVVGPLCFAGGALFWSGRYVVFAACIVIGVTGA